MSDIQRYVLLGGYDPRVVDEGPWVTYADHVAAVAAAQREGANQGYLNGVATNADNSFKAGVKAAREAVERCRNGFILAIGASLEPPERYWIPKSDALAAIDKVVKP